MALQFLHTYGTELRSGNANKRRAIMKKISSHICWQVCNLAWSKNVNELVSTHGYSQNQIMVWKYPSMAKVRKPLSEC